ncbi:hypothetical protein [Kaistia soli]|uniref:hypothetical protein n=1 Tax=Kaistia soli TaxID=446684 RepID=UPI0009332213|nr:hypothetical protein [Kaistia soli]
MIGRCHVAPSSSELLDLIPQILDGPGRLGTEDGYRVGTELIGGERSLRQSDDDIAECRFHAFSLAAA